MKLGSLFAGIGGFELGLERAIPSLHTVWQVEQNPYCQKILRKHWPAATIYDDVRMVGKHNLEPVDVLCGGFPCQDISIAGNQRGIHDGERSGLWWEMHRIISELRPRVVVLENVAAILTVGGCDVVGSLAKIGYDCEWTVISAQQFGAPHVRKRWFCVAYPHSHRDRAKNPICSRRALPEVCIDRDGEYRATNPHSIRPDKTQHRRVAPIDLQRGEVQQGRPQEKIATYPTYHRLKPKPLPPISLEKKFITQRRGSKNGGSHGGNYWEGFPTQSPICRRNDGIPHRVDRIRALGNAIVPQCSQYIGERILQSRLLD